MLNWVVVGIGDITKKRVIPAIVAEPRSCLYGVVSRDPEKAQIYSQRTWTDLTEALHDPAIDAVYVASPVFLHAPQTIAALHAGKHVLCEKPVAMNFSQAMEMVRVAHAAGRILGVAYYRRMYPKVHRARQLIHEGAIGRPLLAELHVHDWYPSDDSRAWKFDPSQAGGGPLFDIASHRIDLLNFFFGKPLRVCAHLSHADDHAKVEDSASLLIEYEHGARGYVDARWNSRVPRDEFRIIGTEGEMSLTPLNSGRLTYPGGEEDLPPHPNLHYPCVENFVSAVLDGAHLEASGESSIVTDWVTEATTRRELPEYR